LIIIPIAISYSIYTNYEEYVNPSEVVVVQPNIDPYAKYGTMDEREKMSIESQIENLIRLSDSIAPVNVEFIIWPETAIPEMTNEETILNSRIFYRLEDFLYKYKNGNLISGIESYQY